MIKQILQPAVFCDRCDTDVQSYDGHPYFEEHGFHYCPECALIIGIITPMEYVKSTLSACGSFDKAEYTDGKLIAYTKWGSGYRKTIFEVADNVGIQR